MLERQLQQPGLRARCVAQSWHAQCPSLYCSACRQKRLQGTGACRVAMHDSRFAFARHAAAIYCSAAGEPCATATQPRPHLSSFSHAYCVPNAFHAACCDARYGKNNRYTCEDTPQAHKCFFIPWLGCYCEQGVPSVGMKYHEIYFYNI